MAQVRKNKKLSTNRFTSFKREISALFYIVIALLFLLSIYSHDPNDPNFLNSGLSSSVNNYIGIFGAYTSFVFIEIFGYFAFILPIIFFHMIYRSFKSHDIESSQKIMRLGFLLITILTACIIFTFSSYYIFQIDLDGMQAGGEIGYILFSELSTYIGISGTIVVSIILFIYSLLSYLNISIKVLSKNIYTLLKYVYLKSKYTSNFYYEKISLFIAKRKELSKISNATTVVQDVKTSIDTPEKLKHVSKRAFKEKQTELFKSPNKTELPLLELLIDHPSDAASLDSDSLQLMARLLESNLRDFGIETEVTSVKPGPVVTLFEVTPAK